MLTASPVLAAGTISAGQELAYVGLLALSGIILLIVGAVGFGGQTAFQRVFSALVGVAMLGYAFWIFFLAEEGDTIYVFWYVFIVPIVLIFNVIRTSRARSSA